MKLVTSDQMRALDAAAIASGIAGEELMLAAGEGLAESIRKLADRHHLVDAPTLFLAGKGNNGGDAFVAARCLHEDGWPVECWLAASEQDIKGDALIHFKQMIKAGVSFHALHHPDHWQHAQACGTDSEIIVDGLLGTGISGEPRGCIADGIRFINAHVNQALIVAIDIPSAMAVSADLTVTMGLPKIDLIQSENIQWVGHCEVVDIGIPPELIEQIPDAKEVFIDASDLAPLFARRPAASHKGNYGHVLGVGGSKGYSGSITMASRAAIRSGAGLVSALVPDAIHALVAPSIPEVMVHSSMPDGKWSSILIGCGMGRTATTRELVLHLLETATCPLILDADAITVLAEHIDAVPSAKCPVILTPHPGEFATLFGLKIDEVQEDRIGMAKLAANKLKATIVLKGAGTVVAQPDRATAINLTGNPGMATGGSGDVLGGLIAGLAAQDMDPFEAACAGVWIHGRAGDLSAAEGSQATLIASDLIDKFPDVFRELTCR